MTPLEPLVVSAPAGGAPGSAARRVRLCIAASLVTLWLTLAGGPVAQEPAPGPPCDGCARRGTVPCGHLDRGLTELEAAVQACSVAMACRRCEGALRVDCRRCEHQRAMDALLLRRQELAAWRAGLLEPLDGRVREPDALCCVTTAHADVVFALDAMSVEKVKLDRHRLAHLYAARVEALRERFVATFELGPQDFPPPPATPRGSDVPDPKLRLYMFADSRDQLAVAPKVTGIGTRGPSVKLMGIDLVWSMQQDPKLLRADVDVWRSMVHNVSHLLLSGMEPVGWVGNQGHGWIDEGVAHWFEYHLVDRTCANFCYEESALEPGANWEHGYWRVGLRRLADRGKLQSFVDLYQKNSDELDLEQHAHAFGFVDWLIAAHGGAKFAELLRRVKAGTAGRDALEAVYGFGPLAVDEPFRAWVRETYPTRR